MNTVLNFLDKFYKDTNTLSIVYIVGAVLIFIFIVILIISLRKPVNIEFKTTKEINDNKDDNVESIKEDSNKIEEEKEEDSLADKDIFEKTTIIPLDDIEKEADDTSNEEENIEDDEDISSDIPDVDEFVDKVVQKTYEKSKQFSSVYVNEDKEQNNDEEINLDNLTKAIDDDKEDVSLKQEELASKLKEMRNKEKEEDE